MTARLGINLMAALVILAAAVPVAMALLDLGVPRPGLRGLVDEALPRSGVEHSVTAVLLNFRLVDTLLEIFVLTLALVGAWSLGLPYGTGRQRPADALLNGFVRRVAPLVLLVSFYLLWLGTKSPGGAFQAGALLGGGMVLVELLDRYVFHVHEGVFRWLAAAAGFALMLSGLGVMLFGHPFLAVPDDWAHVWVPAAEVLSMLSIGAILGALFAGSRKGLYFVLEAEEPADESV